MGTVAKNIDCFLSREYQRFFMPGHKGKTGFSRDLTEVDTLDDLHNPTGAIKAANARLADIYGMDFASMSTCGSTSCVMAMLITAKGKILMGRDAHKSAINTVCLFNLECEFLSDVRDEGYLTAIYTTDAKVLYLTYPGYSSKLVDVDKIVTAAKGKGMVVIVDGAHGAHFPFSNKFPNLPKADMFCVSLHKTMGALTGGAAVFAVEKFASALKDNFLRLHTTSPSFLIMESIDSAVDYMLENPKKIELWIDECQRVKAALENKVQVQNTLDQSRIVISSPGYTGYEIFDIYRKKGIMPEMADMENVIFLTSPYDIEAISILSSVDIYRREDTVEKPQIAFGQAYLPLSSVKNAQVELKCFKDCGGRIAYQPLGAYPPGTAAVLPGEIITDRVIDYFNKIQALGGKIFNMENQMIQVVKS